MASRVASSGMLSLLVDALLNCFRALLHHRLELREVLLNGLRVGLGGEGQRGGGIGLRKPAKLVCGSP